jgi:serine/threonine protein kinase
VRQGYVSVEDSETTAFAAPYTMLEELGRGGMARVYRALDTRSGQVIALKQLLRAQSAELSRQQQRAHLPDRDQHR